VPEPPPILVELRIHERLVELVVTARVTVPAKPFNGATVIVAFPVELTMTRTLVVPAVTAKSCTITVTVTACDRLPLEPATVTT